MIKGKFENIIDCKPSDFKEMIRANGKLILTIGPNKNKELARIIVKKEFFKLPEEKQQNILSAFYHIGLEWELCQK